MRHGFFPEGFIAVVCAISLVASGARASETSSPEDAYLQDLPVVLSASRLSQPLSEAPNAMTVIDRRAIKASGLRSIPELFRLVPGMYVGYAGANVPIVSLNGVSDQYSRRMQVLIDGRSVYLPPFGGVEWLDLPLLLDDIERIEVVRGPAAASHGSNSFYGVINIITRDAADTKANSLSANRGEMGIADVSARIGKAGEDFDYRLSFGQRKDGGDNPPVVNDYSTNNILNLRGAYRLAGSDAVEMQLGMNNGRYGTGTAGRVEELFHEVTTRNDFQQLSWLHTWEGGDESKLTAYRINRDYADPGKCVNYAVCANYTPTPAVQGLGMDASTSRRTELELQNTTQIGTDHRAVWGGGVRYDYVDQPLLFTSAKGLHQSRVFAHDEWRMTDSTLMNVGAMYEDDGAGHRNTSPRLSLNHHLTPQHTVRAMVSSATRNPVMVELYMTTARGVYWKGGFSPPAEDLRPERILSKEIGYVGQFGAINIDSRIYYDKVRDMIMLDAYADISNPLAPRDSFKNLFDATFKGLDISASYTSGDDKVTLTYARQKTSCAFSSYPTQYFHPVLGAGLAQAYQTDYLNLCGESVPANSGSVLFDHHFADALHFSAGYYLRSKVRITDVSSGYPPESQMRRVDLRIASGFGQQEKAGGGEMAVVLQNAFQDNYTAYGNVPQRVNLLYRRRVYFTATIHF